MAIQDNPAAQPSNRTPRQDNRSGGARSSIFRTKTIEQSIAETHEEGFKLKRELRTLDLIVFGVSVVIGAGIFTMTAQVAGDMAGPSVAIAFVIAAITCGLAALCYAEFASTVPVAGSAYTFSFATFGEFVAWIIGWDLVLEFFVAAAVVAKAWSSYASGLFGSDDLTLWSVGGLQVDWGAALLVLVLGTLLARGTPGRITWITTLAIAVIAALAPSSDLGEMVNIGTLFAFLLVALGIPVLRKRYPGAAKFKTPLVPLVPILSALCTVWLMINLSMETWLRFAIWMALGLIMYFAFSRKHSVLETGEVTPVES